MSAPLSIWYRHLLFVCAYAVQYVNEGAELICEDDDEEGLGCNLVPITDLIVWSPNYL